MAANRSSIVKEGLDTSSPSFQDIILEDIKKDEIKDDHRDHYHPHNMLPPPRYVESQPSPTQALPPPPPSPPAYTRTFFTGVKPTTRRWLIGLTVAFILLVITMILVFFFAIRPAQQAPTPQTTQSTASDPPPPSSHLLPPLPTVPHVVITVTATEVTSITGVLHPTSTPLPTTLKTSLSNKGGDGNVAAGATQAPTKTPAKSTSPPPPPSSSPSPVQTPDFLFPAAVGGS